MKLISSLMKRIFALIKFAHGLLIKGWNEREKCRKNERKGELSEKERRKEREREKKLEKKI